MLLHLTAIGMKATVVMVCLALPQVCNALLLLPCAHAGDRWGKKRIGALGLALVVTGYTAITFSPLLSSVAARSLVVGGILFYALGLTLWVSVWFALLNPLVPEQDRAGFFGLTRFSWQSVSAIFGVAFSILLARHSSPAAFFGMFSIFWLGWLGTCQQFRRIPEVEKSLGKGLAFGPSLMNVLRTSSYLSFCSYAFLLSLFVGSCPVLFGMVAKVHLHLPDGTVSLLANLRLMAQIVGFVAGAQVVARLGTKTVFLASHFGYAAAIFLFLGRQATGLPVIWMVAAAEIMFGLVWAASSVAFSTEMMALIPREGKALSTSLYNVLQGGGTALSILLSAAAMDTGLFRDTWILHGTELSRYDAALLVCGTLVMVVVVTLGLVPSVIGKTPMNPGDPMRP